LSGALQKGFEAVWKHREDERKRIEMESKAEARRLEQLKQQEVEQRKRAEAEQRRQEEAEKKRKEEERVRKEEERVRKEEERVRKEEERRREEEEQREKKRTALKDTFSGLYMGGFLGAMLGSLPVGLMVFAGLEPSGASILFIFIASAFIGAWIGAGYARKTGDNK